MEERACLRRRNPLRHHFVIRMSYLRIELGDLGQVWGLRWALGFVSCRFDEVKDDEAGGVGWVGGPGCTREF